MHILFIISILLIIFVLSYLYKQTTEGLNETNKKYCPTCKGKGTGSCLECVNCDMTFYGQQRRCVEKSK